MKKKKSEQLEDIVRKIAQSQTSLTEKYELYRQLVATQKIMKRPPKKFKSGSWLLYALCDEVVNEYLAAPAISKPKFLGDYIRELDAELQRFRDKFNGVSDKHINEYELYSFTSVRHKRRIEKRYAELHPDLAEADALLRGLTYLRRAGIRNDVLEKRFDEVTNNCDAMIIANLPFMEEIYERTGVEANGGQSNSRD